jgi:protease-4
MLRRAKTRWVALRLRGKIVALRSPRSAWLRGVLEELRPRAITVSEIRRLRERMAEDPHVQGLLVYVGHLDAGWATLAALREELLLLRAAKKQVVAYLPVGANQRELFVASAADRVLASPAGSFSALGPMVARVYFARLLQRLGLSVEVVAEGAYKTAAEPLVRESMSVNEREQLGAIVASLSETWVEGVAQRPKLGAGGARALFERAYFGAQGAVELGFVDSCHYEDELPELLAFEGRSRPREAPAYLRAIPGPVLLPLRPPKRVAIVRLEGVIAEDASGRNVALRSATSCLRAVAEHPGILGVILYIDSPGGSAVVSDLLHREIQKLDAEKPVVAWMGNVAASGGYYLAAAARHIVASPATLTGSIGVISARPTASELLEKLSLRQEIVKQAPHADIHSLSRSLDDTERELLLAETRRFYARFLDVVAEGRKRSRDEIEKLAGGRVWAGRDAHAVGLVDTLGGYEEARAALDRELGERAKLAHREPMIVQPVRRDVTPLAPARHAALDALIALEPASEPLVSLWELCRGGEHVLALALDLPQTE